MDITIKRIYDEVSPDDGYRVLVDRLWPRGVTKDRAHLNEWAKELAPSTQARIEFGHNPEHFEAFKHRYRAELDVNPDAQSLMRSVVANAKETGDTRITLLYAAKDEHCNHAMILCSYMAEHLPDLTRLVP